MKNSITILKICGSSDIGKKRDHNEDAFVIGNLIESKETIYLEIPIESSVIRNYGLLVCGADGMGGHNAGEVASDLALNLLSRQLMSTRKERFQADEVINILRNAIVFSHEALLEMSKGSTDYSGMGTTLAGLFFCKDTLYTFHAGDSRIYRLRNGGLLPLTKDHSLVQMLLNTGQISEEEALMHPQKNIITISLGGGDNKCEPEITDKYGYFEDDTFLICSDGLTDMLDEESITAVLIDSASIQEKVSNLITRANERGGDDNITIILIKVEGANG